jgi:hypothetical protein
VRPDPGGFRASHHGISPFRELQKGTGSVGSKLTEVVAALPNMVAGTAVVAMSLTEFALGAARLHLMNTDGQNAPQRVRRENREAGLRPWRTRA